MSKNLHGSKRKGYKSSGARKIRAEKNTGRRKPVIDDQAGFDFIQAQSRDRWADDRTKDRAASFNEDDRKKSFKQRAIEINRPLPKRPEPKGFPLMEQLAFTSMPALDKLLMAACMKVVRVKRYPGWMAKVTHNMKRQPLNV